VVVPAVVVAETVHGTATDARINQLLAGSYVSFVGLHVARIAGRLQAQAGLVAPIDAMVIAEALRRPSTVLTSDLGDLERLAGGASTVTLVSV